MQPVSIGHSPIRSENGEVLHSFDDMNQYVYDSKLMGLGKKKVEKKTEINNRYFSSQIKEVLFDHDAVKEAPRSSNEFNP